LNYFIYCVVYPNSFRTKQKFDSNSTSIIKSINSA